MCSTSASPTLPFAWLDVFTDTPLGGNPLPVVEDADTLDDETMRRLAAEFGQSETTFVLQPNHPGADRRLRSFTPTGSEVTGAGHNTLGAWWWLAQSGRLPLAEGTSTWRQEIGGRTLPLEIDAMGGLPTAIRQYQAPPVLLPRGPQPAQLADALGLGTEDLTTDLPAQTVSTGAAHLLVPAADPAAVDRARPDAQRLRALLADAEAQGCYLFAPLASGSSAHAYARFFNPTVGITEDPATGSAAGPLAAYLHAYCSWHAGAHRAGTRNGSSKSCHRALDRRPRRLGRPSRPPCRGPPPREGARALTGCRLVAAPQEGRATATAGAWSGRGRARRIEEHPCQIVRQALAALSGALTLADVQPSLRRSMLSIFGGPGGSRALGGLTGSAVHGVEWSTGS